MPIMEASAYLQVEQNEDKPEYRVVFAFYGFNKQSDAEVFAQHLKEKFAELAKFVGSENSRSEAQH